MSKNVFTKAVLGSVVVCSLLASPITSINKASAMDKAKEHMEIRGKVINELSKRPGKSNSYGTIKNQIPVFSTISSIEMGAPVQGPVKDAYDKVKAESCTCQKGKQ